MAFIDKLLSRIGTGHNEIITQFMKKTRGGLRSGDCSSFWQKLDNMKKPTLCNEFIYQLILQLNEQILKPTSSHPFLTTDLLSTLLYVISYYNFTTEKRILNEIFAWEAKEFDFYLDGDSISLQLKYIYTMITEKNNIIGVLRIFVESTAYPDALKRFTYNYFIHNKTMSCLSFNLYPLVCLYMTNKIKKSVDHFETAFKGIDTLFNELFDKMKSSERYDSVGLEVLCDLIIYALNDFDGDAETTFGKSQHIIDNISLCVEKLQKTIAKFLIFPEPIASMITKTICLFEVSLAVPYSATFLNYKNRKKFINVLPKDSPLGSVLDNSNIGHMQFLSARVSRALTKSCRESFDIKRTPEAMHIQRLTTSFEKNSGVSMIFYLQHEIKGFNSYFVKLLNIKDTSILYDNEQHFFFSDSTDYIKLASLMISLIDLNLPYDKRFTETEIEMLKNLNCSDLESISEFMVKELMSYYNRLQTEEGFDKEKIKKLFKTYVKETKRELITKAKSAVRFKSQDSNEFDNGDEDNTSLNKILAKIKLLPSEQKYRHFFFSDFVFNAEEPTNNKLELQIKDIYNIIKRNSALGNKAIFLKLIITDDTQGLSSLLQYYGGELAKKEYMVGLNETTDSQVISEYDNSVIDLEFYSVPFKLNSIDCYVAERDKRYQFTVSEPFICKTLLIPFPKIEDQGKKYNFNSFSNNSYRYDFNNKLPDVKSQPKSPKNIDIYGKSSYEPESRTTTTYSEEGSFAYDNTSILISQGNSFQRTGSLSESCASGYSDLNEGGVERIFAARDNYPATQYYRDNVEDYIRNAIDKVGFTIFKVTGEPGDSNITIDEDGWLDNIDADSDSTGAHSMEDVDSIKIKNHRSIEQSQSLHSQTTTRYFVRQLIIRKKMFKKKNKVEPALCSLKIHLANENRVIDIQELKLKYLLIYGFTITTASSNFIYKDSKVHFHNIRDLKEAYSDSEEDSFVLYLLAEASKGTNDESYEFINNHPVIYAKRLKIKCLEKNGNLGLSLESVNMGSYKSLDVEPFYKKTDKKKTYKLFVNRYSK